MRVTYDGRVDPASVGRSPGAAPQRFGDVYTSPNVNAGEVASTLPDAVWVQDNQRWQQVYSARVEFLVTGGDEVRRTAEAPSNAAIRSGSGLGDGMGDDRRLYQTFDTTIAIRSRTPWFPEQ